MVVGVRVQRSNRLIGHGPRRDAVREIVTKKCVGYDLNTISRGSGMPTQVNQNASQLLI
jgi:hypothetical protein